MAHMKSNIPWLDHTFQAEDILRSAGNSALRLSSAFAETGNKIAADKIEDLATAIDHALGHLRDAHIARNTETTSYLSKEIGSTLNAIMRLGEAAPHAD